MKALADWVVRVWGWAARGLVVAAFVANAAGASPWIFRATTGGGGGVAAPNVVRWQSSSNTTLVNGLRMDVPIQVDGTDTALVVFVHTGFNHGAADAVTFDPSGANQGCAAQFSGSFAWVYTLLSPSAGTHNLEVEWVSAQEQDVIVSVTLLNGVKQSDPFGAFTSVTDNANPDAAHTLSIAAYTGGMVMTVASSVNGEDPGVSAPFTSYLHTTNLSPAAAENLAWTGYQGSSPQAATWTPAGASFGHLELIGWAVKGNGSP